MPLPVEFVPDLAGPVHAVVGLVDLGDQPDQASIGQRALACGPGLERVVGARGDPDPVCGQDPADRLDPVLVPAIVDEYDDHRCGRSSSASAEYALACRRIVFARRSSRTSRSNAAILALSSLLTPSRMPPSTSA